MLNVDRHGYRGRSWNHMPYRTKKSAREASMIVRNL